MAKRKAVASLEAFGVKSPVAEARTAAPSKQAALESDEPEAPRTRAKGEKVGVMLRLSREDWYRLHDFANRQGISLQKLVVASLADYMQSKGVRPITGK